MLLIQVLFSFLAVSSTYHGGHTAEYYFSQEEDRLKMNFIIDRHSLTHYSLDPDCDVETMLAFCTANYVLEHSSIFINGEAVTLEFSASKIEKGHLVILFEGEWSSAPLHDIRIQNNCFLTFEPAFKNRIIVDLGPFSKVYQLNKDRQEIWLK